MLRSGNPALTAKTFDVKAHGGETMTLNGTVNKTGISLLILLATAAVTWNGLFPPEVLWPVALGSLVVGFGIALVTTFKPTSTPPSKA